MKNDKNDINAIITQDPGFQEPTPQHEEIMVIGVGGGGVNAASRMFMRNVNGVKFAIINTDKESLLKSPVPIKLVIGDGHGAGDKPDKARKAAEKATDDIVNLIPSDIRIAFVTTTMGGGTGTGATPVIARIVKEMGILTIGIITIPFSFEGKSKIKKALIGAIEMSKHVDALIVINNQKLIDCFPNNTMAENFALADETLVNSVISISDLINATGFWNIDMNDVDTTLRNGVVAIIATGTGEGENRVKNAITQALNSPLLKNSDVSSANRLLLGVYSSTKKENALLSSEIKQIEEFKNKFHNDIEQITGWYYDDSLGNKVKIIIMAAGFNYSFDDEPDKPHILILEPGQFDDDDIINKLEQTPTKTRANTNEYVTDKQSKTQQQEQKDKSKRLTIQF